MHSIPQPKTKSSVIAEDLEELLRSFQYEVNTRRMLEKGTLDIFVDHFSEGIAMLKTAIDMDDLKLDLLRGQDSVEDEHIGNSDQQEHGASHREHSNPEQVAPATQDLRSQYEEGIKLTQEEASSAPPEREDNTLASEAPPSPVFVQLLNLRPLSTAEEPLRKRQLLEEQALQVAALPENKNKASEQRQLPVNLTGVQKRNLRHSIALVSVAEGSRPNSTYRETYDAWFAKGAEILRK